MKLPLEAIHVGKRRREDYGDIAALAESRRRSVGPGQRFRILRRDQYTCRYCGRSAPEVVLEVDHVIPVNAGGRNVDSNLVTSCRECNVGKSDSMDSIRHLWGPDEYQEAALRAVAQRDENHAVALKLAVEAESRYGMKLSVAGLPA